MSVSRFRVQALTLVALLGAVGACTRGHGDDDDPSVLGAVGPISEFPRRDAGIGTAPVPVQDGAGAGSEDMGSSGGSTPPTSGGGVSGPGEFLPPFSGQDAGAVAVGDAGTSSGDAGSDADAGDAGSDPDAAVACWLLCP
jgi:hypothetical protein